MAKRLINETIVLQREGKSGEMERVVPPIGKTFDLTAEEIEAIESVSTTAISKPGEANETASLDDAEVVDGGRGDDADAADARTAAGTAAKPKAAKATPKDDGDL
jgi:hypothetical protein